MKTCQIYIALKKMHHVIIINSRCVNVLTNMSTRPTGSDYCAKASKPEPLSKIQANVGRLNWSTCLSAVSKANISEAGGLNPAQKYRPKWGTLEKLNFGLQQNCVDILEECRGEVCQVHVRAGNLHAVTIMQRKLLSPPVDFTRSAVELSCMQNAC